VHAAVQAFRYINIAAYIALAAVALLQWRRRRDRAGAWTAAAFGSLGLLEILGFVPNHPGNLLERAIGRLELALLVVFPYLLFRFTGVFRRAPRDLANGFAALTLALVVWAFALPRLPQAHETWPASFAAFVAVFLVHWTLLAALTSGRLFRAGRSQPSVARRRMQMLAFASAAITVALLVAGLGGSGSAANLAAQIVASLAVAAFFLGLAPPSLVRAWWRIPEQVRLQTALESLMTHAQTREELAARVLEPAAALVGARAIAIRDAEGEVVGAWNVPADAWPALHRGSGELPSDGAEVLDLDLSSGSLVVWTSPYAPFFGQDELALLRTLGALTGVALDRVRLYEAEHEARVALERANEVKANFVALAAHELRTPMTTVHGFVTTLHHLGDRLDAEQREQVRAALIQQTERMARLIEQLLDLSRLDAEAIEIKPSPLQLRGTLEEIARASAADAGAVELDVPEALVVRVDRTVLERVVGNLVTNAFRYGTPPVRVRAEQRDRHLRVTVEDSGPGVEPRFVPDLFERFTRSDESRTHAGGTGLGLAIARSYAHAHGGDLLYERAEPHGARFRLVLPVGSPDRR
jgi:signal transduction histidine kinase